MKKETRKHGVPEAIRRRRQASLAAQRRSHEMKRKQSIFDEAFYTSVVLLELEDRSKLATSLRVARRMDAQLRPYKAHLETLSRKYKDSRWAPFVDAAAQRIALNSNVGKISTLIRSLETSLPKVKGEEIACLHRQTRRVLMRHFGLTGELQIGKSAKKSKV